MKNKSIPHKNLDDPTPTRTNQLPAGALFKFLIAINELGQATTHQLADWLGLNPDYARQMITLLKPNERGSGGFIKVLTADSRKYQRLGSVPPVYTLNARGREYLRLQEIAVPKRYKESELVCKPHTLAVNQVLTKARVLERTHPQVVLSDFRHEGWLFRNPLKVQMTPTHTTDLKPDLWLDFRGKTAGRYCFFVEVNLVDVTEKVWREKVRAYLHCFPAYKEMFGTGILQVVVILGTRENFPKRETPYPTRLAARAVRSPQAEERSNRMLNLKRWTEAELTAQHAESEADMFLFSYFALDRATPEQLFLKTFFLMPFSSYTYPLLEVRKEDRTDA